MDGMIDRPAWQQLTTRERHREGKQMIIRKAEINDLEQIMGIYELARSFMKKQGNASQWGQTYPPEK